MTMTTSWPERFRSLSLSPSRWLDPEDLAVDDEAVYFTSGDAVYRVDKRTAEITELDKVPNYYAIQLAVDERHVYWVSRGVPPWFKSGRSSNECDLRRVPREGGAAEVVVREQRGIQTLALVDGAIYWVNEENPYDVWDCRVMTCSKRGGAAQELASGLLFPEGAGSTSRSSAIVSSLRSCRIAPSGPVTAGPWRPSARGRSRGFGDGRGLCEYGSGERRRIRVLRGGADQQLAAPLCGGRGVSARDRSTGRRPQPLDGDLGGGLGAPDGAPYLSAPSHGLGRLGEIIIDGEALYVMAERPLDPGRASVQAVFRVPRTGGIFEELAAWPSRRRGLIRAACDGKYIYCDVKPQDDDYFLGRIPT
ncbi:hypothetical protein [Nannocystis pusilla]|uniref:hypothetical protein n=1 Tax=Nannocystis pusilla TaxID=889268 RepID=UPI003B780A02